MARATITHPNDNNIRVFALGGLGEVGKNMYVIEKNDELLIIDSGILFPDSNLGVNYIIPNYTYLKANEHKIVGLFITHGHEDHIGGIPYLLKQVNIPKVYASGLAVGLIKNKLNEFNNIPINLVEFNDNSVFKFNNFEVSFFRTNHSIPDSFGLAVKTDLGYILHTGDFKFDFTPIGSKTDFYKLTHYGEKGVLLLLSDSTNATVNKFSLSEKKISENIKQLFTNIKGRIIISTFASNVYRVQQIVEASVSVGRKVIIFGRSMEKTINVGQQLKYIKAPQGTFIGVKEFPHLSDDKITILSTGSQGEPLAALSRIAQGSHKFIKIKEGDTIVFSSSAIPGNQQSINRTINQLYKAGANVIVNSPLADTHTSGHASGAELQLMLNLTRPKYFMPIHGEYAMQKKHASLAIETGMSEHNCFIMKNGEVLTFSNKKVEKKGNVLCGYTPIDMNNQIIDSETLSERKRLSEDGIICMTFNISKNKLVDKPHFTSRGFIYMKNSTELISDIENKAYKLANSYLFKHPRIGEKNFKEYIEKELSNYIQSITSLKPIVEVITLQI